MKINEFDKQVSQADIDELEKFADKIFAKVGIDVNFTRHFLDRVNDERNGKPISMSELTRLFKQEQKRWGKKIAQLGPDEEGVMKDLQTDINLPFALRWDSKNDELDLIAKTVMRKPNFRTPNPEFPVESIEESKAELYRLYTKAMKVPAGSPKHKELADKIAKLRKELSMDEDIDPVDLGAASVIGGAAGMYAGHYAAAGLKNYPHQSKTQQKRNQQRVQTRLKKQPSVRGNNNISTKPTTVPSTASLPGVTRDKPSTTKTTTRSNAKLPGVVRGGGAGVGGTAINPKRVGGGGRIEPRLRGTPFNMFNESGELDNKLFEDWYKNYYKPARDRFPEIGQTIKKYGGDPYSGKSLRNLVKKYPNIVDQLSGYAKKYGNMANLPDPVLRGMAKTAAGVADYPLKKDDLDFAIDMKNKFKKENPKAWKQATSGNVRGALNTIGIATEQIRKELIKEDFGSVPPLAELILMAVVAKTSVDVLIGMFKVAVKTGKGLKKLNDLRKRVSKMGQGVADYAIPEATKDEFMAKLKDRQKNKFIDAALEALHRLVTSKGSKQSVGGYAFDIARAFNGVNAKELEKMYRAKFSESIIHEDTLNELNILKKKNDGVKQSNPLVVLDKLADRRDDNPFPIKFYDGETIEVTPKMARRFMNKYYDDLEPEQRDIVDRYITTKNGFIQAVKKLQIAEGK